MDVSEHLRAKQEGGDGLEKRAVLANLQRAMFGRTEVELPKVGRYRILRLIGQGAFGRVYAAEDPTLERPVALKVLAPGSSSEQLLHEARAAARVTHPNVIEIYEVGETETGDVFLAMEFVDGQSLQLWLKDTVRSRQAIIDIFVKIAEGLAAVHEAGLIHGDFKPANVLVGQDGRPRVADFGLARARDTDKSRAPEGFGPQDPKADTLNQSGVFAGTPRYMAPEQHLSKSLDARADQFAFCIALYEALSGEHPFGAKDRASLAERVLLGSLPTRWPAAIPRWLRPILRRGLRRDRARRWPDMPALARELGRDRSRKRLRIALGATTIAGLVAVGYATAQPPAQTLLPSVCQQEAGPVEYIWDDRQRGQVRAAFSSLGLDEEASVWTRVDRSMRSYLAGWRSARDEVCGLFQGNEAKAALDPRVLCLGRRLLDVAALAQVLTEQDAELAQQAPFALSTLRPTQECLLDTSSPETAAAPSPRIADRVRATRAELARARALQQFGAYREGEELFERLENEVAELGYAPLKAELRVARGRLMIDLGRYAEAHSALESAAGLAEGSGHMEIAAEAAEVLVSLAGFEDTQLKQDEVARARRLVETYAKGTIVEAWFFHDLALAQRRGKRYEQARANYDRALALKRRILGDPHPDVARTLAGIGILETSLGHYDRADEAFEATVEILEQTVGTPNLMVATALYNHAELKTYRRDWKAARRLARRSQQSLEGKRDNLHVAGMTEAVLARASLELGELEAARESIEKALRFTTQSVGPTHADTLEVRVLAARVRHAEGDAEGASEQLRSYVDELSEAQTGVYGDAQLALAAALWDIGPEHKVKARDRAEQARIAYEAVGRHADARHAKRWRQRHL